MTSFHILSSVLLFAYIWFLVFFVFPNVKAKKNEEEERIVFNGRAVSFFTSINNIMRANRLDSSITHMPLTYFLTVGIACLLHFFFSLCRFQLSEN